MFFKLEANGRTFDNTTEESLEKYFAVLKQIEPSEVMIYSVSRDTPTEGIVRCELSSLENIAARIESLGFKTLVTP